MGLSGVVWDPFRYAEILMSAEAVTYIAGARVAKVVPYIGAVRIAPASCSNASLSRQHFRVWQCASKARLIS
jgi:hypothetical protein